MDSIRFFDSDTQRSLDKLDHITIGPAKELLLFPEQYEYCAMQLKLALGNTLEKVKEPVVKKLLTEEIGSDIAALEEQRAFQDIAKYTTFCYEKEATLLSYMPKDTLIIVDEINRIQETAEQLDHEEADWLLGLLEKVKIVHRSGVSKK